MNHSLYLSLGLLILTSLETSAVETHSQSSSFSESPKASKIPIKEPLIIEWQDRESPRMVVTKEGQQIICEHYALDLDEYLTLFSDGKNEFEVFDVMTGVKVGTHLLLKTLNLMTGIPHTSRFPNITGRFYKRHFEALDEYMTRPHKVLSIIRDPRDQLISHCNWWKINSLTGADKALWENATVVEKCKLLLQQKRLHGEATDLGWQLDCLKKLIETKEVCLVRFEHLVGIHGSGSMDKQMAELKKIAEFIGVTLTEAQMNYLVENIFGTSSTFRTGRKGNWSDYFDEEAKTLFKEAYGHYLIEFGYESDNKW